MSKKQCIDVEESLTSRLLLVLDKLPSAIYRFDTGVLHLNIIPDPKVIDQYGEYNKYSIAYVSQVNKTRQEYDLTLEDLEFTIINILSDLLNQSFQVIKGIELEEIAVEGLNNAKLCYR